MEHFCVQTVSKLQDPEFKTTSFIFMSYSSSSPDLITGEMLLKRFTPRCYHSLVTSTQPAVVICLTQCNERFRIFLYNELLLQSSISRSCLGRENNETATSNGKLSTKEHLSPAPGLLFMNPSLTDLYLSQLTSQKARKMNSLRGATDKWQSDKCFTLR